jgi:hypothetical protein
MFKKMILLCSFLTGLNAFALPGCANNLSIGLDRVSVNHNPELSEKNADYKAAKESLSARPTFFLDLELMSLKKSNNSTSCKYKSNKGLATANLVIQNNKKVLNLVFKEDESIFNININMLFTTNAPQSEKINAFVAGKDESVEVAEAEIAISEIN